MSSVQAKTISGLFNLIGVNRMLDKQGGKEEVKDISEQIADSGYR